LGCVGFFLRGEMGRLTSAQDTRLARRAGRD